MTTANDILETSTDHEFLIHYAKCAEASERYRDMADAMKRVIQLDKPLNVDERNLFSVAYKYIVGDRRKSWRITIGFKTRDAPEEITTVACLKKKIEKELEADCTEVVTLIDRFLSKNDETVDGSVFYHKMKGDYYRYMAEVLEDAVHKTEVVEKASGAYKDATTAAESMDKVNPIRLGLALNYSVFFYEIKINPAEACRLAQQALDDALTELEIKGQPGSDTELILQLLRDNLSLWNAEREAE